MLRSFAASAVLASFLVACGSSDEATLAGGTADAGASTLDAAALDSGASVPDGAAPSVDAAAPTVDAGATGVDASVPAADAGRADAGTTSVDAGRVDAGPACHALSFGQPESIFIVISAAQAGTLTGGTLVDGTYDLVAVETTSTSLATSTLRATWRFAGNTLEQIDQLSTSPTSTGPIVSRTASIAVSGNTITRTFTCGSSDVTPSTFTYDSKLVGGIQTVRVMSGALRFTFEKR